MFAFIYLFENENNLNFNAHTQRHLQSKALCYINIKISKLCYLKIIQVYAPTSAYEDEEVEGFYEEVTTAIQRNPCRYTLIIGDFNAKLGKKIEPNKEKIGKVGMGERNERGQMLIYLHNALMISENVGITYNPFEKCSPP
ncbi:hypothetical protein RN001_006655 [Aquatica leii]|uniref:Craniofacial development protein 2-like n=1 Tax=Aquatica leii TaxID=1421715 RepID=A0AAN7SBK0_9COLE|nr:hypothetical protein RN001_006655 [Aquatica leii]